jgi:tRNA uridine 5-carbamoylmethylation protein Kti12
MSLSLRTVVATVGLPGSGKTCLARQLVTEAVNAGCLMVRVNRDLLRDQLYPGCYIASSTEYAVTLARDAQIMALVSSGWDVICDDTNLDVDRIRDLRGVALAAGADFQIIDMTGVPLDVCIERDAQREDRGYPPTQWDGSRVGESAIRGMYERHFVNGRWRGCDLHLHDARYPIAPAGERR